MGGRVNFPKLIFKTIIAPLPFRRQLAKSSVGSIFFLGDTDMARPDAHPPQHVPNTFRRTLGGDDPNADCSRSSRIQEYVWAPSVSLRHSKDRQVDRPMAISRTLVRKRSDTNRSGRHTHARLASADSTRNETGEPHSASVGVRTPGAWHRLGIMPPGQLLVMKSRR